MFSSIFDGNFAEFLFYMKVASPVSLKFYDLNPYQERFENLNDTEITCGG